MASLIARTDRRAVRYRSRWLLAGAGLLACALAGHAVLAQSIAEQQDALVAAKQEAARAEARAAALGAQASAASDEVEQTRSEAAHVAARIQAAEADINVAEARIQVVEALRAEQRRRLAEKQEPAVKLIAALQTMARRPPALALVQPGSASDMVHVRAILSNVLPALRARTAGLRVEIERSRKLREDAGKAKAILGETQGRLKEERGRLIQLAARQRKEAERLNASALIEQDRAVAQGERARDIVELIDVIGEQTAVRDRLQSLPGPMLRPERPGAARTLPAEQAPPAQQRFAYRLPVDGRLAAGLGEVSEAGVRARGLTIVARAGAQVVAPNGGRVAYADNFRSYGRVVIIDHGGGWTSLITGLGTTDVRVGDTVVQGSPLGRVRNGNPQVSVELRHHGQPVDATTMIG